MRTLITILLILFATTAGAQNYTFSRTECTLYVKSGGGTYVYATFNLKDLTWRQVTSNTYMEISDYMHSLAFYNVQVANYGSNQVSQLMAQLLTWKDSCYIDAGGITVDSFRNFANADLTFTGDRTHALAGNDLTISGAGVVDIGSKPAGGDWTGRHIVHNDALGNTEEMTGWISTNSVSGSFGLDVAGNLDSLDLTDHSMIWAMLHPTLSESVFQLAGQIDTATDNVTMNLNTRATGTGNSVLEIGSSGAAPIVYILGAVGGNEKGFAVTHNDIKVGQWSAPEETYYKLPYNRGTDGQVLAYQASDSAMVWANNGNVAQVVYITGGRDTLDLSLGNVVLVDSVATGDTLYLPAGTQDYNLYILNNDEAGFNTLTVAPITGVAIKTGAETLLVNERRQFIYSLISVIAWFRID